MGRNSNQRRDARRRADAGRRQSRGAGGSSGSGGAGPADTLAFADLLVTAEVRRIIGGAVTDAELAGRAESLRLRAAPLPELFLAAAMRNVLARLLGGLLGDGWEPRDLDELLRRRGNGPLRRLLANVLIEDAADRHIPTVLRAQLDLLDHTDAPSLETVPGLAAGLRLAVLLALAPPLPGLRFPGRLGSQSLPDGSEEDQRKLATVRALLAKAESTEYAEEAETLSAKAQELITRHALAGLLERPSSGGEDGVAVRRIWLDAPYVAAKASLVAAVAAANRCRSVAVERLDLCVVVGDARDLIAVEVLVTSLLVQASAAMVRHGRQIDRLGVSRTRSSRQSFLVSYAVRIGERLREAAGHAVAATGEQSRLLPVLRRQEERVETAVAAMFPGAVARETAVSNQRGVGVRLGRGRIGAA